MSMKTFAAFLAVLIVGSEAIQGPCTFKNVSLMSGVSQKPIVTPSNCGAVTLNASELATEPNIILHSVVEAIERNERYTFMLLEEIPAIRDSFKLRWLVSHATPLMKSLTANRSHIEFAKYNPPRAEANRALKYFLFVYKENKTAVGPGLVGLGGNDLEIFAPQKWVTKNYHIVHDIVGGVEFFVAPIRSLPGQTNTHGGPVSNVPIPMQPGWATPSQQPGHSYPGQPQSGQVYPGQPQQPYPGQTQQPYPGQPGHTHPQPQPGHNYPASPSQQPQPTVVNNYYGKQKDDKKKKNGAANALPMASLVAMLASMAIFRL